MPCNIKKDYQSISVVRRDRRCEVVYMSISLQGILWAEHTQENDGSACGTEGKLETAQYYEGSQSEYERFYSKHKWEFSSKEDRRCSNSE